MDDKLTFQVEPARVALILGAIALVLVLLNIGAAVLWTDDGLDVVSYRYLDMFDLDEEQGFGTWFSAMILLLAGQLTLLVARRSKRAQEGLWIGWLVLGLGFHYLSIDEVAGMHEFLNTYGEELLGLSERWTTYALMGAVVLVLGYLPFLRTLHAQGRGRTLALLVCSGVLYLGGAVGAEKFSPDDSEAFNLMAYNVGWISLEEGLEMAGIILVIYTLLDVLRGGATRSLRLEVSSPETARVPTAEPVSLPPASQDVAA